MRFTPRFSSSRSDFIEAYTDGELYEFLDCDDFWWDEEERHELF